MFYLENTDAFFLEMFYLENAETCSAQIACHIWTILKACTIHMGDMKVHSKSWESEHLWTFSFATVSFSSLGFLKYEIVTFGFFSGVWRVYQFKEYARLSY